MRQNSGFTLIELMIVIAILGILLAIAIPAYSDFATRARVSESMNLMAAVKSTVSEARINNGRFLTGSNDSYGLAIDITSRYVASVVVAPDTAVITATVKNTQSPADGMTLLLTPTAPGAAINWTCTVGTLAPRYAPSSCR